MALRCHRGLCQWTEILSAGVESRVVKGLLHFWTPLITLTFDHVLCAGSWFYESLWRCFPPNRFAFFFFFVLARLWVLKRRANSWKGNRWRTASIAAQTWLMSISYQRSAYFVARTEEASNWTARCKWSVKWISQEIHFAYLQDGGVWN